MQSIDTATPQEWDIVAGKGYFGSKPQGETDVVNRPHHYNAGSIECIDAIKESMEPEQFLGYLKGNCLKYLWRYEYKGKPVEDLRKARWYLERLIKEHVIEQ